MKCPICKLDTLASIQLQDGPPAYRCGRCEGIFLSSAQYWEWLKSQKDLEPEIPLDDTDVVRADESGPRICPSCGHLLTRFKVWPDVPFFLDSCGHCNSIWLDKNEWQTLQEHHLHNRLNLFLTRPWQEKIRAAEAHHRLDTFYRQRFGDSDYARIQEIRAWLTAHKERAAFLAYLASEDPYKP
jgi:Zn-finger nucleic acid-binding protein